MAIASEPLNTHPSNSMELQLPSLPFLFSFLLFILVLIKVTKSSAKTRGATLPPSPWKIPIIGHLHYVLGTLPHHAFRQLSRRYGPVMHLKLGQVDHIIISSAEAAKEIMTTHDLTFASRPKLLAVQAMCYGGIDIAFSPYGSYWRQLRKICMLELLSAKRVTSFRACREEETSNLVRNIFTMSESPINLSQMFLLTANTVISRVAFGKKCAHGQKFISAAKRGIELASGFDVADLYPTVSIVDALCGVSSKVKKVHREVDEILEEIVKEHQERRATINSSKEDQQAEEEDLVDVLLGLKEKGELEFPLTIANIKAVILEKMLQRRTSLSTQEDGSESENITKGDIVDDVLGTRPSYRKG